MGEGQLISNYNNHPVHAIYRKVMMASPEQ
jgi:hypothetical protein